MLVERSEKPILKPETDWETDGALWAASILPEEDGTSLRLYYLVRFGADPLRNVLCIARSTDGYTWERPDLGDGTNIVMRSSGNETGWGMFMPKRIVYEQQDEKVPWKMIYWERPTATSSVGICMATSLDGIAWQPMSDQPVIDNANDAASFTPAHPDHDETVRNAKYLLYQQTWKYNPGLPQDRDNLKAMHRRISLWYSPRFSTKKMNGGWIGPVTCLEPDEHDPPDLQHYWLTPFHTSTGYGGLLNCHHTIDQSMDTQYVTSEDGWTWKRELDRKPIVPLGPRGSFDCGMVFCASAPISWNGKTLIPYNGRATLHDGVQMYPEDELPEPSQGMGIAVVSDVDLLPSSL